MSHLPGTIHVKRKLVEEPPETLYVEREGRNLGSSEYHARLVYRLLQAPKRPRTSESPYPDYPTGQVPQARSTSPPTSQEPQSQSVSIHRPSAPPIVIDHAQPEQSASSKNKNSDTLRQRRVFHLSASKAGTLSRVSSNSSLRSILRRRGKHGSSIAVFAEKRASRFEQMARSMVNSRPETPGITDGEEGDNIKQRKRPLTKSMSSKKVNDLPLSASFISTKDGDNEATMELAAELHKFALETTMSTESTAQPAPVVVQTLKKKPMKYQPRPPPARNVESVVDPVDSNANQSQATQGDDTMDDDDSGEWVYDVYIRDTATPTAQMLQSSKHNNSHMNKGTQSENVGYIVIRTEDEEAWEEFMSDEEDSEGNWGGDDEDSNAEDYYANDYPDELDSDDEWALGKNSDESDNENYHHSDGERY